MGARILMRNNGKVGPGQVTTLNGDSEVGPLPGEQDDGNTDERGVLLVLKRVLEVMRAVRGR